jgi:cytochrome c peroxidase
MKLFVALWLHLQIGLHLSVERSYCISQYFFTAKEEKMNTKKVYCTVAVLSAAFSGTLFAAGLTPIEQVGKSMYQDRDFSFNGNQSCLSCHHHISGFADPTNMRDPENTVVSLGDDEVSTGGRNAPSSAYAGFSPRLSKKADGAFVGGMFWDGRATGDTLGDPLAEQAQGPPLNPVEMGMPDKAAVVQAVRDSTYALSFLKVFGSTSLDDVDQAYDSIARAIAAYERSIEVQSFNSRYDMFLAGGIELNAQEQRGLDLFTTNCTKCHSMETNDGDPKTVDPKGPLFTNYTYANIGVPTNIDDDVPEEDEGLGGFLKSTTEYSDDDADNEIGKFKVPTLRNVAMTAPYSHNGYFSTLKEIIQFKNTRDGGDWPQPDILENLYVSSEGEPSFGNLGLSEQDVDDLVAFLNTLTDR